MSLLAGEAPPYLLLEGLFTVSSQERKGASQGRMLPLSHSFFSSSIFIIHRKKITILFLYLNLTAQKDFLTTSTLIPTELFRHKRALCLRHVQRRLRAGNQGPPVAAETAASLGSPLPPSRQLHSHMCDLFSQKWVIFCVCPSGNMWVALVI